MTPKELYRRIGGDYEQALRVLRVEKLPDKHIRKFAQNGLVDALVASAFAYVLLALLAVTAVPDGNAGWPEYVARLGEYVGGASGAARDSYAYLRDVLDAANGSFKTTIAIHVVLIVLTLTVLFSIYAIIQKRERQIEVEKALAEDASRVDSKKGVGSVFTVTVPLRRSERAAAS